MWPFKKRTDEEIEAEALELLSTVEPKEDVHLDWDDEEDNTAVVRDACEMAQKVNITAGATLTRSTKSLRADAQSTLRVVTNGARKGITEEELRQLELAKKAKAGL